MKFGIKQTAISELHNIFSKYPSIEQVLIYGSRAKGTFREDSDIDLLLCGMPNSETLNNIKIDIKNQISDYEIDIKYYNDLEDIKFRNKVDSYAKIFFLNYGE